MINDSVCTAIDLEPDQRGRRASRTCSSRTTTSPATRWGQTLTSWFVAANPAGRRRGTAIMDGLTVTGNRVHAGAATADNGNADGLGGLGIRSDKANLKRNFVHHQQLDGRQRHPLLDPLVINLANVQNLTVTGNRQPITNGSGFLVDTNTTGTRVVSGNDTSP